MMCFVFAGLRAGDEILTLNGVSVASLDLGLMQSFFSQQDLHLVLRREENSSDDQCSIWPDCDPSEPDQPQPPKGDIIHPEQLTTGRTATFLIRHCSSVNTSVQKFSY